MFDSDHSSAATPGETTLEGRVEILGEFPRGKFGQHSDVKHSGLFLKTDEGRIVIYLGPAAYFLQHNFQIKAGDTLKVTGFPVVQFSIPLVQARVVKIRGKKLKLRDKNGLPLWPAALDRAN